MPKPRLAWLSQGLSDAAPDEAWLSPREAVSVARLRFLRRRDAFRLGRWTAKKALALSLGRDATPDALRSIEIASAPDGAPVALVDGRPAGAALSLTGRADQAVAFVGPYGTGLGCDLELVEPRSDAFVADYLTPAEQRLVLMQDGEGRELAANLVWCGKEAALKVLRTGLRRDTRSVEVSFPPRGAGDDWAPLSIRLAEGPVFTGWWRRFGEFVLALAASEPFPPPPSLIEPPGLHRASPIESWLGAAERPAPHMK